MVQKKSTAISTSMEGIILLCLLLMVLPSLANLLVRVVLLVELLIEVVAARVYFYLSLTWTERGRSDLLASDE